MRTPLVLVLAVAMLAAGCGSSSSGQSSTEPSFASQPASGILRAAVLAARGPTTMDSTYRGTDGGRVYTEHTVLGVRQGDEQISDGGAPMEIALYHDTLVFRGTAGALERVLRFSPARANAAAGRWLSEKDAMSNDEATVAGLDLGLWREWLGSITNPVTKGAVRVIDGHRAIAINGYDQNGPVTVYVDLAAPHRPVAWVTGHDTVIVRGWNVPLYLPASSSGAPL